MTRSLLADENVDHRVVYLLGHYGYDVEYVDFVDARDNRSPSRSAIESGE